MHFSEIARLEPTHKQLGTLVQTNRPFSQLLAQIALISLVCASILAPFILISPALPAFRVEILLLPVVCLFYGWFLLSGHARMFQFNGMFLVGAVYGLCVLLSTLYGAALLGQTLLPQDFYELPKLFLPVVFFTVAYEADLSETGLRRLFLAFAGSLLLICIYAWGQWADMSFSQGLNEFYTAGKHVDDALVYARRVYSTMGNPNVLGELLVWAIAAFLLAFFGQVVNRALIIFLLLCALVTLGMTGSRYGVLNASLAIVLVMVMPHTQKRGRRSQLLILLILLPLFTGTIALVSLSNPKILERYQTLKNPLETDSTSERFEKLWLDALDDFYASPLLGRGPAKDIYASIITDSEYLGVLKEFGLTGLLSYLAYYFLPLALIWRGLRAGRTGGTRLEALMPWNYLVMRLGFVMVITALVMNIGMSTFYNQLLQGFLWMWMGFSTRSASNIGGIVSALSCRLVQPAEKPFIAWRRHQVT